jgi:CxxC-x17-CxxC domain-containing protein
MIVFRVGADDAEFLEKEFEPEFTPQDIVNLPNFKVYLKLMIDGVSSRPFSAKTLAPMVKSGNKEIEDEVIKSSRDLYCRPREVVEREINNWSGMSIGDDNNIGGVERFPTICSICKKDTTVPFKPEVGRAVYCKDCIAKIKSGEIKPIAGSIKQIKQDETKFYKPLADLGIEFKSKDGNGNGEAERYPERVDKSQNIPSSSPKIFSTIKKVFVKEKNLAVKPPSILGGFTAKKPILRDNTALREILNKTLSTPLSISLNELKNPTPAPNTVLKDRSASKEDMDKLKNFISETVKKEEEIKIPVSPVSTDNVKEVPEDVLRKILE